MPSLPPKLTGRAWDCGSAAPLLNRTAAACGLPTILRAAQDFVSHYQARARRNGLRSADTGLRCGHMANSPSLARLAAATGQVVNTFETYGAIRSVQGDTQPGLRTSGIGREMLHPGERRTRP